MKKKMMMKQKQTKLMETDCREEVSSGEMHGWMKGGE
jgi:hypothetical protein